MKALLAFLAVTVFGSFLLLGVLAHRVNKVSRVIRDASELHAHLDAYIKRNP